MPTPVDDPDVIIVGAGHNGLTAGCYLALEGLRVTVVEASAAVGGMTSTNPVLEKAPGHRINEGAMDSSLSMRCSSRKGVMGVCRSGRLACLVDEEDGDAVVDAVGE